MATITEAYVSFETVKLLKKKGMDKECFTHYIQKNNSDGTSEAVTTCTQQMAMAWLREEKGLFVEICCDDLNYNWQILDVWHIDGNEDPLIKSASYGGYNEYERAVENAIKYVLENLI